MAFRIISNPATRIQHLLNLAFGDARGGRIEIGSRRPIWSVAETLQKVDQEFGSVSAESSALVRALTFQRWVKRVKNWNRRKVNCHSESFACGQKSDPLTRLAENPARSRESLAQVALSLTFVQKWLSEVRERKIRLEELA